MLAKECKDCFRGRVSQFFNMHWDNQKLYGPHGKVKTIKRGFIRLFFQFKAQNV